MGDSRVVVLADAAVVTGLSDVRRDILSALDEPDSATGLSGALGMSRQKVNYHMRALESAGLVELLAERPRRGLTERIMRRTADVVLVDPEAFATTGLERPDVAGVSGVVSTAADLIRHAAKVSWAAANSDTRIAAVSVDTEIRIADPNALRSLLDDLATLLADYDSTEGLRVRFAGAVLPAVED